MGMGASTVPFAKAAAGTGANDRIRIGIIGCGDRGINGLMKGVYPHLKKMNVEITALCDPWSVAREQANEHVRSWFGRDASRFVSYRDLLAMENVDAVMIASPDHLHTTHMEAAAGAGKHIYIEKPMATEMDKLIRAYDAVKKAGVVVQVGTQIRSLPGIEGCRELFGKGTFGNISRIEESRNSPRPYWYRYLKDIREEDVDWAEFLHDRPARPFCPNTYSGWYGYEEFSHGPISAFGSHFIDLVHCITGAKLPESCICIGRTFTWKDEYNFTAPDCVQATWIYPEGFMVTSSNNLGNGYGSVRNFYGDKANLILGNWNAPLYNDEGCPNSDGSIDGSQKVNPVNRPDHFLDWLQCIRGGGTPNASLEAGYQHAVAVLMAAKSRETGRKVVYDRNNRSIRTT